MAISVISQGAAASATLTLGTFAAGDLIVAFAFRDGSTTAPSLATGFTQIDNLGANSCSSRAAYRIAVAGDTTFAFTNATEVQHLVLRGHDAVAPIGTFARGGAADNQPLYGAISSFTNNNGSTWIIGFAGHRDATDMSTPTAAGMTKRAPTVNTLACHTAENVSSFAGVNFGATVNASTGWRSIAIEVIAGRTQLFTTSNNSDVSRGTFDTNLGGGTPSAILARTLDASRGGGFVNSITNTVNGPTSGIEVVDPSTTLIEWLSAPLAADTTIALPITANLRMSRSAAANNMGPQVVVERIDSQGVIQSTVLNSEMGTENASAETAMTWTATPTSTAFNKGDRIRVRVAYNDAGGTAASGGTETFFYNGTTAGASGDSYVIFGETLTFASEPAGTTIYPTTTAASDGINPGSANEYEAWTARGGGVTTAVRNTAAGATAPLQMTETAGGTALEWYTRPLVPFTLGGAVRVNIRGLESNVAANAVFRVEVAVCDQDGSNATVWAAINHRVELTTSEAAYSFLVSGDDTSVAAGKRLRIRVLIDDAVAAGVMGGSQTVTLYYAGTSGGASGDTYLTFTQTLNEAVYATPGVVALTLTTFAPTVTASAGNVTVTPDLATLTTATFAPAVSVSDNKTVTPDVAALTTTGLAPVIKLGVTPDTASLTTATFAPTVSVSDNQSVTPDTASLSTVTFAPTVSVSDNQLVTPGVASLTTATFAPTVALSDNQLVTPDAASLSLTAFAPSVILSDNQLVTPDTASLSLTAFAPDAVISDHQLVTPDAASLTLTTFAPSAVVAPLGVYIPDTAALTLTTYAPTVTATGAGTGAYTQVIIIV